jgi:hypothetical protein
MSRNQELMFYAIVVLMAVIIGSMFGANSVHSQWRLDAAVSECAQFNPSNGQFEWLTNEK